MTSRRRLLLLLTCLLLALALGVFALSQSRLVRQRILAFSETLLADALGREVRVEAARLQPWAGVLELARVRVARERTLAEGALFSAETIRTRWSWTALLRGRLVLRQVVLTRPRLTLPAEAGPGLTIQDILPVLFQAQPMAARGWVFRVREAAVQDGRVTWTAADGTPGVLEGLEGDLAWTWAADGGVSTSGSLRVARLAVGGGGSTRQFDRIGLQAAGTIGALSVRAAEFSVGGATVTARGEIADLARGPRLELGLEVQAPLERVLSILGAAHPVQGTLSAEGRLQGPWEQPVFQGEGALDFAEDPGKGEPFRFSVRWEGGRLEVQSPGGAPKAGGSFRATLALAPSSGLYRVRATLEDTDLATLAGLPAVAAAQVGLAFPPGLGGRLSGEADLTGRGTDLAALRGQVRLRGEELALPGETPSGRLDASLSATASRVDVETISLRLPGGEITGRGSLSLASGKLDLPVRADLRDMAAFGREFGLRFLGGQATLRGRVLGTREAPRLHGRVRWREARIAGYPVDLIAGDVEIARRVVRTSHLTVRSGRSIAILRGSLAASGTAPLRRLDPKRDLVLDLQVRLSPARTADLVGLLPDDVEVRGGFRASGWLRGTLRALAGEVEVGFENVRTWQESWQRGEALFRLRPGGLEITRISLQRGAERLTGDIGIGVGGALDGRLTSGVMDLAKVGSLSGSQLAGRASFRLEFRGTLRDTVTLGQATASALVYRDIPLGPGSATFKVERKAVAVDLTFREGTQRLQVSVGPPSDRSVKGELTLADADLEPEIRVGAIDALRAWRVRGSGRIRFQGAAAAPAFERGEAELTSLGLRSGDETWASQGPVRLSWKGRTMTVRQLRLRSGQQAFDLQGTLGEGERNDLTLTGRLPLTLLAGYLPVVRPIQGLAIANVRLRGDPSARNVQGRLEIRQGQIALPEFPADFLAVQAAVELLGNRAEIRQWQGQLAEGTFRGAGEIGWAGKRWDLRLSFQENDGRAEQLLRGLYGGKGHVTGALSLGGNLGSDGEEVADFWGNLGGDLKLVLRDGRIGRYGVVAKILALLNMAQLLEPKGVELGAQGMPYDRLTADIKIARGIARTENLVLDSRAMKLNAVGEINLVNDSVDVTVAAKPLQNVDWILANIPFAGWLLGGKEKSILVAYFHVTGPLTDPEVRAVPVKSIQRNVFGILRNLLEIPEALTGPYEDLPPQQVKPDEGQKR